MKKKIIPPKIKYISIFQKYKKSKTKKSCFNFIPKNEFLFTKVRFQDLTSCVVFQSFDRFFFDLANSFSR